MTINLKVDEHIYNFFYFYLEVHYQVYQNNPLSMYLHSIHTHTPITAGSLKSQLASDNIMVIDSWENNHLISIQRS
jgi:hypothetical protein